MKNSLYLLIFAVFISCSKPDPEPIKSSAKSIRSFSLNTLTPPVTAALDSVRQTITATFPIGTDITRLVPTITISERATLTPASGLAQDFSKPVSYTVTAENGSTRVYLTSFTVRKSTARSIRSFAFRGLSPVVTATIDSVNRVITATVPANTNLTRLTPTITFSDRATLLPASGLVQDFSKAVVYTVTAESGENQTYTVQIGLAKSSAKFIRQFYFDDFFPNGTATVDTAAKTIVALVPGGADLSKLKPTIVLADKATVSPSSGAIVNFTNQPAFTVTAEDGTKQTYSTFVAAIANKPLSALVYGKPYAWKKAVCRVTTFPTVGLKVTLFETDVTCATASRGVAYVEFNVPASGLGTFRSNGVYFYDNKGTSTSYFFGLVQITSITNTTIVGKVIAGNEADGNVIEGNFEALLCL